VEDVGAASGGDAAGELPPSDDQDADDREIVSG